MILKGQSLYVFFYFHTDVTQLLFTFYQVTCMVTCTFLWHFNIVALIVALWFFVKKWC